MRSRRWSSSRRLCMKVAGALILIAASALAQGAGAPDLSILHNTHHQPKLAAASSVRIDVNLVLVPITVTDAVGKPVLGLPRQAFQVFEDGVEQRIVHFMNEDAPVSLAIVFDASASMERKIDKSREAVARLFRASMPEDEYLLISFNDTPRLLSEFTRDVDEIQERLSWIRPRGWTALLDAIYLGLNRMKTARNTRKALLVISDGGDNNSRFTASEIRSVVRESDVSVYAIGILGGGVSKRSMKLLSKLAEDTGGRLFPVSKLSDLPDVVASISMALRDQYVLGYRPSNAERDGKYRRVKVKIAPPPDAAPLRASWRTGYYAPY